MGEKGKRERGHYRGNLGLLGHQAFPLGLIRQRNQTMQWEEERGGRSRLRGGLWGRGGCWGG